LAWALLDAGATVKVVDPDEVVTSSKIAAGLLTAITGMRWSLTKGYADHLPEAYAFYRRREREMGVKLLYPRRTVRLICNADGARFWAGRRDDAAVQRFVSQERGPGELMDARHYRDPSGGIEMKHGGYLDTAAFLDASRAMLFSRGSWTSGEVAVEDLGLDATGVTWAGQRFSTVVFCQGWQAARHPWFDWVPFRSVRGTIVSLETDLGGERRIVNNGAWVLPRHDGVIRAGATYDPRFDPSQAQVVPPADITQLEKKLTSALAVPFAISAAQSGVRPIIEGRRILIGRHPGRERVAFFNGLGSKGSLRAPHYARLLCRHLMTGEPLPVACDLRGNL
jgi:glycine/D-amino acid oxidase-like deaminating enzyme